MRIAISSSSRAVGGGAEVYLQGIVPELARRFGEVGLWYESDGAGLGANRLDFGLPSFCLGTSLDESADQLKKWQPDIVFVNRTTNLEWFDRVLRIAPVVYFAHDHQGTCISGTKSWKRPEQPCQRRLGPLCMVHYFPNRCGGLNPLSMFRLYSGENRRLALLGKARFVVTNSGYVRSELIACGLEEDKVVRVGLHFPQLAAGLPRRLPRTLSADSLTVLYVGRMIPEKGGHHLIEAASLAAKRLKKKIRVIFAGEGPATEEWQRQTHSTTGVEFEFRGWVSRADCELLYESADIVVVPSIWPEPLGMIGVEAAIHGLPVVSYGTGGITDWLSDGINGHLAPCDPPRPEGLAEAIVKTLCDADHYTALSKGALENPFLREMQTHADRLEDVLRRVDLT